MKKNYLIPLSIASMLVIGCNNALTAQNRYSDVKSMEEFEEEYEKDGTTRKFKTSESKFDKDGNEIEVVEYEEGKFSEKHEYTYDDKGNKITDIKTKADGKKERIEYKYDENYRRTEKLEYSEKGRLKSRKTYIYKMK